MPPSAAIRTRALHFNGRLFANASVLAPDCDQIRLLREAAHTDWQSAKAAVALLDLPGKDKNAIDTVRAFHCQPRVARMLDPACGSGNFLYVTLEHMRRLKGDVFVTLEPLGETPEGQLQMEGISAARTTASAWGSPRTPRAGRRLRRGAARRLVRGPKIGRFRRALAAHRRRPRI